MASCPFFVACLLLRHLHNGNADGPLTNTHSIVISNDRQGQERAGK